MDTTNIASIVTGILGVLLTVVFFIVSQSKSVTKIGSYYEFVLEVDRHFDRLLHWVRRVSFILSELIMVLGIILLSFGSNPNSLEVHGSSTIQSTG